MRVKLLRRTMRIFVFMPPLLFLMFRCSTSVREDNQQLIFEKFTQSDSSITRRFGGSGLGLAISLQLMQITGVIEKFVYTKQGESSSNSNPRDKE